MLAALIVIIGLLKMVLVMSLSPILGYANSYDFVRQSSCTGLWQVYPDDSQKLAQPSAPVNSFQKTGRRIDEACLPSIDHLFPLLAALNHSIGEAVDIREVSAWKGLATVMFISLALVASPLPSIRVAFAFTFFLVFGDLSNLLYANTLYVEYSVLLGAYFGVLGLCLAWARENGRGAIPYWLAGVALVWLGTSKQQYGALALLLLLLLTAKAFSSRVARIVVPLTGVLILVVLSFQWELIRSRSVSARSINLANTTDTFLYAVLPESREPSVALRRLGLPESCGAAIGRHFYEAEMQSRHPCPEVADISRLRLIRLFMEEPRTFLVPLAKATERLSPFMPTLLGHTESPATRTTTTYKVLRRTSFSTILSVLPPRLLPVVLVVSLLAAIGAGRTLFRVAHRAASEALRTGLAMVALGGLVALYAVVSAVFGDGYVELQKHAIGFLLGISIQCGGVILLAGCALRTREPLRSRDTAGAERADGSVP